MNETTVHQNLTKKIELLLPLVGELIKNEHPEQKKKILLGFGEVKKKLENYPFAKTFTPWDEVAALSILAIGQDEIVFQSKEALEKIVHTLGTIERFYLSLGGIVGYYTKTLQMICDGASDTRKTFERPPLFDMRSPSHDVQRAVSFGISLLPKMAEIYPIGGLGDRLNLRGEMGEPLPAAMLPFCGRSLLEGLIRDVEAREYLYYKLFGEKIVVPIGLMTSHEKENENHIHHLLEKNSYFGRPKESFFIFSQLSVPVITKEGNFSMREREEINLHPGGHGALWRTAEEKGVYKWLQGQKKEFLLIRQINNPIAGLDNTLLALLGKGGGEQKTFGFASCQRLPKTAEGMLVLEEEKKSFSIMNIEYTDFAKVGIEDVGDEEGYSLFPTNTNILFASLPKLLPHIHANPLPGLVLNMKTDVPSINASGEKKQVKGGRLESMMQSIAETLRSKEKTSLPTFVTYNERLKTISTTKRSFEVGKSLLETPQGAFYDLLLNNAQLLKYCKVDLPGFNSPEEYLAKGPEILFLYHPALGPLYDVIASKIQGGKFASGAELQLEIAEIELQNLALKGSLLIKAEKLSGKCSLFNVTVDNLGVERDAKMLFWKNEHKRKESVTIDLRGSGEFHAENVTLSGSHEFVVPDGERWVLTMHEGHLHLEKEKIDQPTWDWQYRLIKEEIKLFKTHISHIPS